jgi:6-phosphogluconolactonase
MLAAGSLLAASGVALVAPGTALAAQHHHGFGRPSTVYTESNQTTGNTVLAFRAAPGGALLPLGAYWTGGTGTGASPSSQGGVTLGDDGSLLAVVNGGSNSVTVFAVGGDGRLFRIETAPSGGVDPISVAIAGVHVYVLNAGSNSATPNITGFNLFSGGRFEVTQPLNALASSPEDVAVSPNGRFAVVTEKASNTIDAFAIGRFGGLGAAVTTTLAANTGPYGFSFLWNGNLVVSEAAFGGLATFSLNASGTLSQISQVPDGQLAPCWTTLTHGGSEVITTNAHSGTISAYAIAGNGTLTLLLPAVQASTTVAGDTDIAVAGNSTLYTSVQPNVLASRVLPGGDLGPISTVASGFPTGTFGLAATS